LAARTRLIRHSKRIYFDGYLPPSKLNIRLERLRALTRRLNDYYHASPAPFRVSSLAPETNSKSLLDRTARRSNSTNFPAAPFLVPAIMNALGDSETYKAVLEVVPGEADLYCGRYLKQHGGLVLTGDSDLLVHELGINGSVGFFQDIETLPGKKPGALRGLIYFPASIADRLSLPSAHGLRTLAFEMVMDCHGTFRKLLSQACDLKAVNAYKDEYVAFLGEYDALPAGAGEPSVAGDERHTEAMKVLRELDPRISEYVLQFPSIATWADRRGPADGSASVQVFLPFLVDCPVRTTAWEASISIRQLAYGLLKLIVPKNEQAYGVVEHRRQNNLNGKGYQVSNSLTTHEACMAFVGLVDQVHHKCSHLDFTHRWIAFAICQEIGWSSSIGKHSLSTFVAEEPFSSTAKIQNHANCTWDSIHFLAQMKGIFYSLRMLQQISRFLAAYEYPMSTLEGVSILCDRLKSLTPLRSLPSLSDVLVLIRKIEFQHMVRAAHDILGVTEPRSPDARETSKRAKKKRKAAKGLSLASPGKKQSNNVFEMLDVE
jgi:hypothetical protein